MAPFDSAARRTGGTSTDKLARAGIALLGCGILVVNLLHVASITLDGWTAQSTYGAIIVIIPGLIVGAVLVAGARAGRTADRRFVGVCAVLAGAVLVEGGMITDVSRALGTDMLNSFYVGLVFGPAGPALGAPLLAIGVAAFSRDRLVGLCMMIPGVGFLPFTPYYAIYMLPYETGIEAENVLNDVIYDTVFWHGVEATGAAMAAAGLAIMWQTRRAKQGCAPEAA